MSAKPIHEYDGKLLLAHWLATDASTAAFLPPSRMVHLKFDTSILANRDGGASSHQAQMDAFLAHVDKLFDEAESHNPWVREMKLVCKPDQLIKRRGKAGLLGIGLDWAGVKDWIRARAGREFKVGAFYLVAFDGSDVYV